jgi:chemotaxis protein MotB
MTSDDSSAPEIFTMYTISGTDNQYTVLGTDASVTVVFNDDEFMIGNISKKTLLTFNFVERLKNFEVEGLYQGEIVSGGCNNITELFEESIKATSPEYAKIASAELLAAAEVAKRKLDNSEVTNLAEIDRKTALLEQANELLAGERALSAESQRAVALLNQQTAALRTQLSSLQGLLDAYKDADREAQVQLQTLGSDLNTALARVAAEQKARAESEELRADLEARERERLEAEAVDLRSFRSEFFGRVREVLSGREGVQVVGDRFVFSSEVLFALGSAELGAGGKAPMALVAAVIRDIGDEIPSEINWVLRVDGHTDKIGVGSRSQFADNWELSQARALSVVKYLIDHEGIPANRLAATGFGEFQPVDEGDSPEALAANRRIELKLTEK